MKNKIKNILSKLKDFIKSLTILKVIGIIIILYFCILIYKQIGPQTYREKYMSCLKLGSDMRARSCIGLINR